MEQLQSLDRWHQTRKGNLAFGVVELLIAYGFASWAINTAHTWCYALGIIFLVGGIHDLARIFRRPKDGKRRR